MEPTNDRIQFIGHASVWITLDGHHFMIDANFSPKILGMIKRQSPLGISLQNLPDVSALLVTHAHYDHLDLFSYKFFSQDKIIISPPGIASLINRFVHNPVRELKTWQETEIDKIKITAVPTKHSGFRLSGFRYTRCHGYILQGSRSTVYHPGDTAYGPHFKEIGSKFKIDVACLPIGSYRPQWTMKNRHLNPKEALQAFDDLGARIMIPIHWGSFRVAWDKPNEPLEYLNREMKQRPDASFLKVLRPGEELKL